MGQFYKDVETGLYYLNSRYYNPEIGRFINADGLIGETGDILGHNMYAYIQNNPVMNVDPSGYDSQAIFSWGMKIAAMFAVADGPLPFGDTIGLIIAGGTIVIGGGYLIYEHREEIQQAWLDVKDYTSKSYSKVKGKVYNHDYEKHHIVMQGYPGHAGARRILDDVGIGLHSDENTVYISTNLQKIIHNGPYKDIVAARIYTSSYIGKLTGTEDILVRAQLASIKVELTLWDLTSKLWN